jgi:hypothetical protein
VQVVGYDNNKQAWLVKNSWGDGWASEGYGWVAYSAPGICDPGNTYGFTFTPKQPPAAAKPQLTVVQGRPGCWSYTAVAGDHPEGLASRFGMKLQQLLLDNLAVLQDPSTVPPGAALVLCGVSSAALAGATVTRGAPASAPVRPAPAPVSKPPAIPPVAASVQAPTLAQAIDSLLATATSSMSSCPACQARSYLSVRVCRPMTLVIRTTDPSTGRHFEAYWDFIKSLPLNTWVPLRLHNQLIEVSSQRGMTCS